MEKNLRHKFPGDGRRKISFVGIKQLYKRHKGGINVPFSRGLTRKNGIFRGKK